MASRDGDYAERYSHATVSRWESGTTRPSRQRLNAFGKALNLSPTGVAGLIMLAGLDPEVQTEVDHISLDEAGKFEADDEVVPEGAAPA